MDQSVVDIAGLNQGPLEREIAGIRARREPLLDEQKKLREQRGTIGDASAEIVKKQEEESAPLREQYVKKAGEAPTGDTKEEKMPDFQRPQFDPKELNETFGMLMVASMFLGSVSRGPYNNVMNAMTGAINGFLKGDHDNVEEQFKIFDKNIAAMKERNTAIRNELNDAEKKWSHDLAALKNAYEMVAAKYDLPLAQQALKDKNLAQAQQEIWREIQSLDSAETRISTTLEQGRNRLMTARIAAQTHADALAERRQAHADAVADRAERLAETQRHNLATEAAAGRREDRLEKPTGAQYDKLAKEYMAASGRLYANYQKAWNKARGDTEVQEALDEQYNDSLAAMIEGYENRGLKIPSAAAPAGGKGKTSDVLKFDEQGNPVVGET